LWGFDYFQLAIVRMGGAAMGKLVNEPRSCGSARELWAGIELCQKAGTVPSGTRHIFGHPTQDFVLG
jgi:hypothetical protein